MVADGYSFASAYVDFQSRVLKPLGAAAAQLPHPSAL